MSHRTRERPAECLASLSHSTMIDSAVLFIAQAIPPSRLRPVSSLGGTAARSPEVLVSQRYSPRVIVSLHGDGFTSGGHGDVYSTRPYAGVLPENATKHLFSDRRSNKQSPINIAAQSLIVYERAGRRRAARLVNCKTAAIAPP
ncbi:hypothetical protein EVAR_20492_1 [Eumeta japonica]|uniref:Uncharacterized protein n=1 Tax=Eumeta variegata TaxID=151549 RepID=A0A4C1Y953_EUMVA|nr:hypothetical protein EVAR_20492_1 [Eumeta japonica]